jgi:hypothetical protein
VIGAVWPRHRTPSDIDRCFREAPASILEVAQEPQYCTGHSPEFALDCT